MMLSMYNRPPKMLLKIREWLKEHPKATIKEVAEGIGCEQSYVWHLNDRYGLDVSIRKYEILSEEEREEVKRKWRQRWRAQDIAEYFSVSAATVRLICKGIPGKTRHWTLEDDLMMATMIVDKVKTCGIAMAMDVTEQQIKSHRQHVRRIYGKSWTEIKEILQRKCNNNNNLKDND